MKMTFDKVKNNIHVKRGLLRNPLYFCKQKLNLLTIVRHRIIIDKVTKIVKIEGDGITLFTYRTNSCLEM